MATKELSAAWLDPGLLCLPHCSLETSLMESLSKKFYNDRVYLLEEAFRGIQYSYVMSYATEQECICN